MARKKRLQLSRGWKTVRNFAALALVLAGCWGAINIPYFLMEYELRKDVAQELTILWKGSLDGCVAGGAGAWPTGGAPMILAQGGEQLHVGITGSYEGHIWIGGRTGSQLEPGTPMLFSSRELADVQGPTHRDLYLLAVGLPEITVRGEVGLTAADGTVYTTAGQRDMDVIWFPLFTNEDNPYNHLVNASYSLTLYDESGAVLSCTEGLLQEREEETT